MKLYKYLLVLSVPLVLGVSCKKSLYVKANEDPSTLTAVDPGDQFLYASSSFANSFEAYYDFYRDIMPWMQYSTGSGGNPADFTNISGNFDTRYSNYYTNVGLALADIPHLISNMTTAQQAARQYEAAIASIYMAYYTFYVSDINGSIPYSQAFQGRYGGTLTPVYDTQQSIFDTLDTQIKNAVAVLESNPSTTQVLYGGNDPFYSGVASEWAKAGNALRLKIAMRQINLNPSVVQTIAQSVLSDLNNQMDTTIDSWVLYVGNAFAVQGGNFDPSTFLASAPIVNFMNATNDPREGIFYRKNSSGVYLGSPTDPDTCADAYWQAQYKATDTPISPIQHRLFTPNYNENDGFGAGSGTGFYPALTYAEYCFIRAYLGAKAITSDDPGTWYNKGVTASIEFYSAQAKAAAISGFTPVTGDSIAAYLGRPGVLFSTATAANQIACQAYLDFYRQPSEGWAWWKMTGYPNTTSVIAWEPLTSNSTVNVLNRRAALTILSSSDANYTNQQAAFAQMESNPLFGLPADAQGRVWWDVLQ